ncbi:MAG: hypothetical protein HY259_10310 [Chloroflexi bacterium]|nr:hypothetical protein [Chloroflexota bacterium]
MTEQSETQAMRLRLQYDLRPLGLPAAEPAVREYEVTLIAAGPSKNGLTFPADVLREAAPLFEGATSFVDHLPLASAPQAKGGGAAYPTVRDVAGVFSRPFVDASGSLRGTLRVFPGATAHWLCPLLDALIRERERGGTVPNLGLSADLLLQRRAASGEAQKILKVFSADIVFDPAAGGQFQRILNSTQGGMMDEAKSQVSQPLSPVASSAPADLLRVQCAATLSAALGASDLPAPFKDAVREQFDGRIFDAAELSAALDRQRALYAALLEQNVVEGAGASRSSTPSAYPAEGSAGRRNAFSLWSDLDRLQFAADRLLGAPVPDAMSDVPRLSGIRELYVLLSGDREMRGIYHAERVTFANAATGTMTGLVKNAMNKVIAAQWQKLGRAGYNWWQRVVYEDDFESLNQISWITVGGFGDLPTVSEGAAYTELAWGDNAETTTFVKKGGYIGLTLEMMDRDQTQKVKAIPVGLATAGIRTLSNQIAVLFTQASGTGPTLADGLALFETGTHKNLRTTALSAAEWDVVVQKVFQQAELKSGKRLGLRPRYRLVPIELEKTSLVIDQSEQEPGTANNDVNVRMGNTTVVVPEWTDTNDWAAVVDPDVYPCIGVGYRYGRMPEVFVADQNAVGSMFTNDEMRIKVRFIVGVGIIDYRGLHKSNV